MKASFNEMILLAEDDLDDQEFLVDAFAAINRNIKIHGITNGNKTIGYLQNLDDTQLPSLIILDYNLPELNGAEILEILQKDTRYQYIPKIIWSTSNSPMYRSKCLQLGAKAYMVKPSDVMSIENMAKEMLRYCTADAKGAA